MDGGRTQRRPTMTMIALATDNIEQVAVGYSAPEVLRGSGELCRLNGDCESGCCLLKPGEARYRCQETASLGDRCTIGQIKGGRYFASCPCAKGKGLKCRRRGGKKATRTSPKKCKMTRKWMREHPAMRARGERSNSWNL
ncbi:PREDICTED: uncharacterized protein LOC106813686 [Priapulus caudatus]|uniref:Uncharacterized protein LOC106813686 n=1 Tax=Priapulus caudatus TaxID=37621 RepID=A0ABM1EMF8_PRICU|nr:PREDICTED: uncharacterized protein LOC106813686 [Priapulus caudatus]